MFYLDLFETLNRHQASYAVVGGLAMNLLGVPRLTMDVDLVAAFDEANMTRFFAACRDLRLSPAIPVALAELADADKRAFWLANRNMKAFSLRPPKPDFPTVDVLIDPAIDAPQVLANLKWEMVNGVGIPVANARQLLRLKSIARRPQDLADIEHLRRLAGENDV